MKKQMIKISSLLFVMVAGTVVCLTNTGRDSKIHMD